MCYNCGCGMPDNNMGDTRNITNKTFEEAAKAAGQSVEEAKRNALQQLKKELEKKKNKEPRLQGGASKRKIQNRDPELDRS